MIRVDRLAAPLGALTAGLLFVALATPATADSVEPTSVDATIRRSETLTVPKTVTITAQPPPDAPVDVFFLFDTTGSMDAFLTSMQAGKSDIFAGTAGLGDLAWGVGTYQDFPISPYGFVTDSPYTLVQDLTTNVTTAGNAIDSLSTGFGGDVAESQLHALDQASTTVSWREDSTRMIVWFGDAPGHDGSIEAGYPSAVGVGDVVAALGAENIVVQAVDVATAASSDLDDTGQATAITLGTGGSLTTGVDGSDVDAVVQAAIDSISEVVNTYSSIELEVVGDTDNTTVVITPPSVEGDFERDVDRDFLFELAVTGEELGVDDFEIRVLLDGVPVASEIDHVEVVPEPTSVAVFGLGALLVSGAVRRKRR